MYNIYEVSFFIKSNNHEFHKLIHIEAPTAADAKTNVKELWQTKAFAMPEHAPHMFRINCRRIKDTEVIDYKHWFTTIGCQRYKKNR